MGSAFVTTTPRRSRTADSTNTASTSLTELSLTRNYSSSHDTVPEDDDRDEYGMNGSLLQQLDMDKDEEEAWRAAASPRKVSSSSESTPNTRHKKPLHVPASCFPSLKGRIPSSTPTTPVELETKIHNVERAQVQTTREGVRYSIYVNDSDFETPKSSRWKGLFRHKQSNSISEVFTIPKRAKPHAHKSHKPSKSASVLE